VVTGRYDILAEVVFKGEMEELYRITSIDIPKVGNVVKSETFVVMKSNSKWVSLPRGMQAINRRIYENCRTGRAWECRGGPRCLTWPQ
jgi:hypothetical protein